jgi:DNA-binding NarL/FixJ family response regulator
MMDDISDAIGEIYDAIGDTRRWRELNERLAARPPLPPELAHHLEMGRRAQETHVRRVGGIDTWAGIYDQLALGALVVSQDASLLHANGTARHLLAERGGLALADDRVCATDPQDNARLHDAIARAAAGGESDPVMAFVAVARQDKPPLSILTVSSTDPGFRSLEGRLPVMLVIIDPALTVMPAGGTLRALYGFTARESEFALLLMRGLSVEDASTALGVSMTTARTFLSQITAKTDCHSQGELMVRLLATPRARVKGA